MDEPDATGGQTLRPKRPLAVVQTQTKVTTRNEISRDDYRERLKKVRVVNQQPVQTQKVKTRNDISRDDYRERLKQAPVVNQQPVQTQKKVKTRNEISRDYRQRQKQDPVVYQAYKEAESCRFKEYYARRSEEAIQRNRELQRVRQQRYRHKIKLELKENGSEPKSMLTRKTPTTGKTQRNKVKKPTTNKRRDDQRKKWCEEKRTQRLKMSREKKLAENESRREAYAAKKGLHGAKAKFFRARSSLKGKY